MTLLFPVSGKILKSLFIINLFQTTDQNFSSYLWGLSFYHIPRTRICQTLMRSWESAPKSPWFKCHNFSILKNSINSCLLVNILLLNTLLVSYDMRCLPFEKILLGRVTKFWFWREQFALWGRVKVGIKEKKGNNIRESENKKHFYNNYCNMF